MVFEGKVAFTVTFKEKVVFFFVSLVFKGHVNYSLAYFERIASSHEKLYNEQWRIFYCYIAFYYDFLITHL